MSKDAVKAAHKGAQFRPAPGRAHGAQARPPLREEMASLDLKLLSLFERRVRLAEICREQEDLSEIFRRWQASFSSLASGSPLLARLFEALETASFQKHEEEDAEHEKLTKLLHEPDALESLLELDRRILGDLSRRSRLLGKICASGHISVSDEKFLRERWQQNVTRLKGDGIMGATVFMCLQGFLPGTVKDPEKEGGEAFALYSARRPVQFCMTAPLDFFAVRAWLYIAAAAGQPVELWPVAPNDAHDDFLHILSQLGAKAREEGDRLHVMTAPPLARPDRVIQAGSDGLNLFLLICHYLGAGSRVKITGDLDLRLMDLSFLRKILPALGARVVHMIPKSSGLPLRLECSGILPPVFEAAPGIPCAFVEALLLCSPFYEQPFAVDLSAFPERQKIAARLAPVFEQAGIDCNIADNVFNFSPQALLLPATPQLPLDTRLASFLLAMAQACRGEVVLAGNLPPPGKAFFHPEKLARFGLEWSRVENGLRSCSGKNFTFDIKDQDISLLADDDFLSSLFCCLAAIAALGGGKSSLPPLLAARGREAGFFAAAGLSIDEAGKLSRIRDARPKAWTAPGPWQAMALGLAALVNCWRSKIQLANPAITRKIWLHFWSLLNSFTKPMRQLPEREQEPEKKSRRIRTQALAVPPQIREEDWER